MKIIPLPVFEADADPANRDAMTDQERYEQMQPPTTIVVRSGYLRTVAEYPYNGKAKPGCGSKLVARTHRGTEVVEMLTTTCPNAGCGKSVTRQEMLDYIEHSGGKDYPFRKDGRVLRVATIDDLNRWSSLQSTARENVKVVRKHARELDLDLKVVEVEPVLSEEMLTIYYMSEERIDFRELVKKLAAEFECRIEMRQVGARDEARIVADYERCGQHCCCKNFLKVLKPVSMRSAKTQKATLDPLKISGRCGRLMCCLRYEDETYEDLKKRLPRRKSRVGTPEGPGIVLDTKILVQLALVQLEEDGRQIAVPIEELGDPDAPRPVVEDPLRGLDADSADAKASPGRRQRRGRKSKEAQQDAYREQVGEAAPERPGSDAPETGDPPRKKRRRRRRRKSGGEATASGPGSPDNSPAPNQESPEGGSPAGDPDGSAPRKKRRRRRRRRRGGGDGAAGNDNGGGGGD